MTKPRFDYRLRVSPRARRVRLRVSLRQGLEVIVPTGYDTARVSDLLERKKHWIAEALERAERNRMFVEPEPVWKLPLQVKLQGIGATWHLDATESAVPWVTVRELAEDRLLVVGNIRDERECRSALSRWLRKQTKEYLVPRLQTISLRTGLRYHRVFVKRQRTRWASCSKHKSISLNVKLLFLPTELVDYVMTHELCHLAHMSHSKEFWNLVEKHCPRFRAFDNALREMWKTVPIWAN